MKSSKGLAMIMVAFVAVFDAPFVRATCVGHFYNKSNFQWSIAGFNGDKPSLIIPPNATIEIPWGLSTTVTISGAIPGRPYVRQFQVQSVDDCVVIQHQGNTGNVTLNKPTNGDVATCVGGC